MIKFLLCSQIYSTNILLRLNFNSVAQAYLILEVTYQKLFLMYKYKTFLYLKVGLTKVTSILKTLFNIAIV